MAQDAIHQAVEESLKRAEEAGYRRGHAAGKKVAGALELAAEAIAASIDAAAGRTAAEHPAFSRRLRELADEVRAAPKAQ